VHKWLFFALSILLTSELKGQSSDSTTSMSTGRFDQIQAERLEKSRNLDVEPPPATGETFSRIGHFVGRVPISFDVGGLGPGAGVGIGSVLQETTYSGHLLFRTWGHLAFHNFYNAGVGAELRNFPALDLKFALEGSHADAPQLEYYGEGQNSSIHNRTNFRREDTLFNFRVELHPHRHVEQACRLGENLLNVGPGTNESLATTESVFGPSQAPGIDVQSNYLIGGCSAALDLQDFPDDPHKGTFAAAAFDRYYAQNHSQFSFYRLSLAGEQYVPFFNRKRVIALRAKTVLSFHSADQVVPFYLQATLGSDTELRGYRRYRFYDENSLALTAEYRWEISTGFDMALFVDGGKVFDHPGQLNLSLLKSSAGFGLRFKNQLQRRVVARLDTGFSTEGFQIWLKVANLF
jgi:hypothetical protein